MTFNPSLYNFSLNKFYENFLEKIKAFILSKNLENKSLNSLFIFHRSFKVFGRMAIKSKTL